MPMDKKSKGSANPEKICDLRGGEVHMKSKAYGLLKRWCDKLISLQLPDSFGPELAGGIMCPACHRIHGRCADALPAFSYLYEVTGDARYYDAAKRVFHWSERNMRRGDGSMYNDSNSGWKCIAVFAAISLGETIMNAGKAFETSFMHELKESLLSKAEYVASDAFLAARPVVNYPCSSTAALQYAGIILDRPDFCDEAERRYRLVVDNYITPDNLLYGEGHPSPDVSPKGCCAIDMGYNMEESYSNLAIYASLCRDPEKLKCVASLFRTGLDFLLPDGGLDNSFGCRSDKWTYYGSRTSDGMAVGLSLLYDAGLDPEFYEAACRNLHVMERCTSDGLLSGGVQYGEAGEPPCSHHAITHSKALVALCRCSRLAPGENNGGISEGADFTQIPGASVRAIKEYKSAGIYRVRYGGWTATACVSDCGLQTERLPGSGGTLTLIYHRALGVISASSMAKYFLSEPNNMQLSRHRDVIEYTAPRIVSGAYCSAFERNPEVSVSDNVGSAGLSFNGRLCDISGKYGGNIGYEMCYRFEQDALTITLRCDTDADFLFYAVSDVSAPERLSGNSLSFGKSGGSYTISASSALECDEERTWTPCGGFMSFPIRLHMRAGTKEILTISV